jgi:hypothetical protein
LQDHAAAEVDVDVFILGVFAAAGEQLEDVDEFACRAAGGAGR